MMGDPDTTKKKIFIGGLNYGTDDDALRCVSTSFPVSDKSKMYYPTEKKKWSKKKRKTSDIPRILLF